MPTQGLVELLKRTIQAGPKASLKGLDYGRCFGMGTEVETVGDLLGQIVPALFVTAPSFVEAPELIAPMQVILGHGPLATRLLAALPAGEQAVDREALREICRRLADCTANGEMFVA